MFCANRQIFTDKQAALSPSIPKQKEICKRSMGLLEQKVAAQASSSKFLRGRA
jgi:hypothetical protein